MTLEPLAPSLHENVKIKFGCNAKGLTVMSERRDYVALEWVAGEINETLDLAEQALQEYNDNPQDISKLRFCLSHLHQVHGTLQMVEFFGAGLLAAEMKAVATALIEGTIHDSHRTDAQAVLSQAIALLPRYLAQVKKSRHTLPATLLPVLNDLRAVRGESLLSETVLFSVSLEDAVDDLGGATEALDDDQLRAVANKLRQMFQIALLGLIRGQQLQKNLNYLAKVCARLVKLSAGQPSQPLWRVCIAVLEGLLNGSIETSVAVKMLLRQVDREIKALVDEGQDGLRRAPAPALLKNLLYYVARSDAESKYILEIKDRYKLQQALPGLGELGDDVLQLPDANTLSALVAALRLELEGTSVALVQAGGNGGNGENGELLAELVATLGRSCDALAILGLGGTLKQATAVRSGLAARLGAGGAVDQPELENFAAAIVAVQRSLGAGDTIALAAAGLPPRGLQQQSYEDLVRQSRPGLALVKEAIIEYVATQCDRQALMTMPAILSGVSDRLAAGGLNAAATIIDSCNRYMSEELLAAPSTPSWQQLDTLADALASVDYYLERIAEDEAEVGDAILDVAANSVAALRYPLANTAALEQPVQEVAAPVAAELVTELATELGTELATKVSAAEELLAGADIAADPVAAAAVEEDAGQFTEEVAEEVTEKVAEEVTEEVAEEVTEEDPVDPEIIEIFVEEAGEVLEEIGDALPRWKLNRADSEAQATLCRCFHTLKGSGKMVGAKAIGDLAWSLENLLNRISEGAIAIDDQRFRLIDTVVLQLPSLVTAFERAEPLERRDLDALIDCAERLAREQNPQIVLPVFDQQAAPSAPQSIELDPELMEIFAAETMIHGQVLEAFVAHCDELAGPAVVTDELQRALHTLKGSANMAGIIPVANIVTPVEYLVKQLRARQLKTNADVVAQLQRCLDFIGRGISQLATTPLQPLAGADDFIAQVERLCEQRIAAVSAPGAEETGIPPEALNNFLGDSLDRVSEVAQQLTQWREGGADAVDLMQFETTLAAVVEQAKTINMWAPAEFAEGLEVLYRIGAAAQSSDTAFFALAERGNDALIDMLDQIAGHQQPQFSPPLLAEIRQFEITANPAETPAPSLGLAADQVPDHNNDHTSDIDLLPFADYLQSEHAASDVDTSLPEVSESLQVEPDHVDGSALAAVVFKQVQEVTEQGIQQDTERNNEQDTGENTEQNTEEDTKEDTEEYSHQVTREYPQEDTEQEHLQQDTDYSASQLDSDPDTSAASYLNAITGDTGTGIAEDDADFALLLEESIESDPLNEEDFVPISPASPTSAPQDDTEQTLETSALYPSQANDSDAVPGSSSLGAAAAISADESDIDAEIVEIFLEEADDLLEDIDNAIHRWELNFSDLSPSSDLLRILHTLKGGARLAGLLAIGDLSHNFETSLIRAENDKVAVDERFMHSLQRYQDVLISQLAAIKFGADAPAAIDIDFAAPAATASSAPALLPAESQVTTIADPVSLELPLEPLSEEEREAQSEPESQIVTLTAMPGDSARSESTEMTLPLRAQPIKTLDRQLEPVEVSGARLQEMVKVPAQLLEELVNLAGETSISRGRAEEQMSEIVFSLDEMQITVDRLQEQVRRLDMETEQQILYRQEQVESEGLEGFDPLEMDRYSQLQQLSRSLLESSSDLIDIKSTLSEKSRDIETLLVQQSRINTDLQEGLLRSRMVPFQRMVPRLRRIIRQISSELGKSVELQTDNIEGELDRAMLERMVAPLEHMLRNAVDHGIESVALRRARGKPDKGIIKLNLIREGGEIVIELSDDGAGIDGAVVRAKAIERGLMDAGAQLSEREILTFIMHSGFSTAAAVTQISGRGVGMEVVASEIKQLGGSIEIESTLGLGSQFTIRLPFTVSVNRALMVSIGGDQYAIPLNTIEGIVRVSPYELEAYYQPQPPAFEYAGQPYQLRYMGSLLQRGDSPNLEGQSMPLPVLLVRGSDHSVAIQVDSLMGSREIVVKPLGPQFTGVQGLSGATVLGDGSVVVILDLMAMIRADISHLHRDRSAIAAPGVDDSASLRVMVIDDSVTVRKVTSRLLERLGMEVVLAQDGVDAVNQLNEMELLPDVLLLDIEMPRMDGFEVANRVRHTARLKHIPIIMITSRTGTKHRERALALGVDDYMGKPYQETELLEKIAALSGVTAAQ